MSKLVGFGKKIKKAIKGVAAGSADTLAVRDVRLTTGSLALNYALGGGLRVGWITLFFGDKSGGKTTSAKRSAALAQGVCRNCFRRAKRDLWQAAHVDASGEEMPKKGAALVADEGEVVEKDRIGWHDWLVGQGYELNASQPFPIYSKPGENGPILVGLVRMPGGVEDVPPSAADLAEDPDVRWSGKAWCDCFATGVYKVDPPAKASSEKPKEYEAKVERWKLEMTLNSYEEFVVAWQDNEGAFDRAWFEKLGGNLRRLFYMRCTNAEEAIDIYHALALTGEVDLAVIDSIAQLVPAKELTASMEEWQQGLQARLVNKAARKILSAQNVAQNRGRPFTQIWINQTRDKIGVMYGDPSVKPGGKGQDFAIHGEVKFNKSKVETIEDVYGAKDKGETVTIPIKETFHFKNTKNRTEATRDVEWSYTQLMRANDRGGPGTIVEDEFLFKLAMRHLVVADKKKNTYTIGDRVFDTQREILQAIREEAEWSEVLREVLLSHMLKSPASAFSAAESAG